MSNLYLTVVLAKIGEAPDKKERLLIINRKEVASFPDANLSIEAQPKNFLTISYGEFERNQDNWKEYRAKLIAEKIADLEKPLPGTIGAEASESE